MNENYIGTIIAILMTLVIGILYFDMQRKEPEVPNIDGVMMRNEAQMYNGYEKN